MGIVVSEVVVEPVQECTSEAALTTDSWQFSFSTEGECRDRILPVCVCVSML